MAGDEGLSRRLFVSVLAGAGAIAFAGAALWSSLQSTDSSAPPPEPLQATPPPPTTTPPPAAAEPAPADAALRAKYPKISEDLPRYFEYLKIPDATLDGYLRDLGRHGLTPRVDQARESFLKSTDFFPSGADESKPLAYLTLYDPYRSPCFNPFKSA